MANPPSLTNSSPLPFLRTSLDANQIQQNRTPTTTGTMSVPSSNQGGATSVSTRQGDGDATRPGSDANASFMSAKFEKGRPPASNFQIGAARAQPESGRTDAATNSAVNSEPKVQAEHYNNANLKTEANPPSLTNSSPLPFLRTSLDANQIQQNRTPTTTGTMSVPSSNQGGATRPGSDANASFMSAKVEKGRPPVSSFQIGAARAQPESGRTDAATNSAVNSEPKVQAEHYNNANLETIRYSNGEEYIAEASGDSEPKVRNETQTDPASERRRVKFNEITEIKSESGMLLQGYLRA